MAAEATALLRLKRSEEGGLRQPLRTPTPSLVFRPLDTVQVGLVGVIHLAADADLTAGAEVEARVVFPGDDSDPFVTPGREFLLWNGRTVGSALLREVLSDS